MQQIRASMCVACTLFVAALVACIVPTKADDGAACQSASDCKSGECNDGICNGSTCTCPSGDCHAPGSPSSDCASGWVCVFDPPDPITGFFGASGSNSCTPTCGHCPPHWSCDANAANDSLCSYNVGWRSPQVTIDAPTKGAAGDTLTFHAHATSAIGAKIIAYDWSFGDNNNEAPVHGADVTHAYANAGPYTVQVHVTDDGSVTSHFPEGDATTQVTICATTGHACAGGNDCCDEGKTCQYNADAGSSNDMVCQ